MTPLDDGEPRSVMPKVLDLAKARADREAAREAQVPYFVAAAFCLECAMRWIATLSAGTNMFRLECPHCHYQNSFISVLPDAFLDARTELGDVTPQ